MSPVDDTEVISVLQTGEYLGEMSFVLGSRRTVDVRAVTWVNMQALKRDAWIDIMENFPETMRDVEMEMARFAVTKQKQLKLATLAYTRKNMEQKQAAQG